MKRLINNDAMYQKAVEVISKALKFPVVKVDREAFLRSQFKDSEYIDIIIEKGPQHVYSVDTLRDMAAKIIKETTNKTSMISFMSGLPGNPLVSLAVGSADVVQFFGFALSLAQQIAYLFGESNLSLNKAGELSDEVKAKYIVYLGVMFGVSGAIRVIHMFSREAGIKMGKSLATKTLTKTMWYPFVKKIGSKIGKNITKKTVERTVIKAVPIVGGVISGGLTYVTFKPMGTRLADALANELECGCQNKPIYKTDFIKPRKYEEEIIEIEYEKVEED